LFLSYHTASFASRRTSVHLHFSGLPIDLWVVVLEPGITKDYVLPSEAGDSEERSFGVGFVTENHIYHFRDLTCLVGGAIHIVHQYGARDAPGVNIFRLDKVSIYKFVHSSGVQKRLDGMYLAGVCGADFYWQDDRCPVSVERGKREVYCDKQIGKAVIVLNCVLKSSWGEGGSRGIRKKLKSEYAAYLESKYRRNDGSSI